MKWLSLAMLLVPWPVAADDRLDPIRGNGLFYICSQDEPIHSVACSLYIRGMDHMLSTLQIHGQVRQHIECAPDSSTANQRRDVFVGYLKANPQSRHLASTLLYMRAMAEAFPCPANKPLPPIDKKM